MEFKRDKRTEVKVNIYGEQYSMRMPTVGERENLLKEIDLKNTSAELYSLQKEFVKSLGLPMEVINSMEDDHFNELAKVFIHPKKN